MRNVVVGTEAAAVASNSLSFGTALPMNWGRPHHRTQPWLTEVGGIHVLHQPGMNEAYAANARP
jgi:hypothetical protein